MIGARRPPMVAGSILPHLLDLDLGGTKEKEDPEFALRSGGTNTNWGAGMRMFDTPWWDLLDIFEVIINGIIMVITSISYVIAEEPASMVPSQHKPLNPQLFFAFRFPTSLLSHSHTHTCNHRGRYPQTQPIRWT